MPLKSNFTSSNPTRTGMNIFESIDNDLKEFAGQYNAEFHTYRSSYDGKTPLYLQERRIIWIEGNIGKAVLISPYLESYDSKPTLWDFLNLAWLIDEKNQLRRHPFWEVYLFRHVKFEVIEKNIKDLLVQSTENLAGIRVKDLKTGR